MDIVYADNYEVTVYWTCPKCYELNTNRIEDGMNTTTRCESCGEEMEVRV